MIIDFKDKEEELGEIYTDDIEEMKENLERKDYMLEYYQKRYEECEKILKEKAKSDVHL
jgi:hypothetical protein